MDDGEGWRGFSLSVDGSRGIDRGSWADSLTVRGKGFGGDDDQAFRLVLGRRGTYRVVLDAARTKGSFDIPGWQRGQHVSDRVRDRAGIEITLYPKRATAWLSFRTRSTSGLGTTTQAQGSNQFLLLDERDADSQDLRVGGRIPLGPVTVTLEQALRKTGVVDDMSLAPGAESGNRGNTTLGGYTRRTNAESDTSVSRIALQVPFKDRADLSLTFVRADGEGDEVARRESLQVRPGPPGGIERLLDSDATLDRLSTLLEAGLSLRLTDRLSLEDTFRFRDARFDGDVDQVATSIIGGNPTVTETESSRHYDEESQQNAFGLSWRADHGVVVRAGARTASRELAWEEDGSGVEETSELDETRLFANATWRPGPKIHLQGELEHADVDAADDDPKLLTRTWLTDAWTGSVRLVLTPRAGTTVGLSLRVRSGDNDSPPGTRDEDTRVLAASVTHSFGKVADLRASLARTLHDSDTALTYTDDGVVVDALQKYEMDNTTLRVDVAIRRSGRVSGRVFARLSETDGSRPTRWYRVEPRLDVRATSRVGFVVGWYRERFDRPGAPDESFTAEGVVAWLKCSFGPGSEPSRAGTEQD